MKRDVIETSKIGTGSTKCWFLRRRECHREWHLDRCGTRAGYKDLYRVGAMPDNWQCGESARLGTAENQHFVDPVPSLLAAAGLTSTAPKRLMDGT